MVHVGFVMDEMVLGQVFLQALQFSPANYHSTNAPYSSISELVATGPSDAAAPRDSVLPHSQNYKDACFDF
jgi:hypothetical protein